MRFKAAKRNQTGEPKMEAKHTPGPLTVKIDEQWPFRINTYNRAGEVVFSVGMPCHSTSDERAQDAIECRGYKRTEREQYKAINRRAIADEVLRAAAPELLEALKIVTNDLACLVEKAGRQAALDPRIKMARAAIAKAQPQEGGEA